MGILCLHYHTLKHIVQLARCDELILWVNLARLWYTDIQLNISPDIAVKVLLDDINI